MAKVLSALAGFRKKRETTLRNRKTDPGRKMVIERLPHVEDFLPRFKAGNSGCMEKRKNDLKSKGCGSLTMDAEGEIVSDTTVYSQRLFIRYKKR